MRNKYAHGRWIVAVGAVTLVVASFMQWWLLGGGENELPAQTGIGVEDGAGFLLFLAALATLLLVALPYAAEGPVAIDQPITFVILLVTAFGAYCLRTYTGQTPPVQPLRGPGYWLAAVALVIFARGVFEMWESRRQL